MGGALPGRRAVTRLAALAATVRGDDVLGVLCDDGDIMRAFTAT
jgi:hypothetical protein